jgi:hypothetical protein
MCSPASVGKTSRLKHGESSGNLSNDGSRPPTFPPHHPPHNNRQGQDIMRIARTIAL